MMALFPAAIVGGAILWSRGRGAPYRLLALAAAVASFAMAFTPLTAFTTSWHILFALCLVALAAWNLATGGANRPARRPRYLSQPRCPK